MLVAFAVLASIPLPAAVTQLEYWTFENDGSSDGLRDAENSGTMGSSWNFNTTTQGDLANGSGQFVMAGDSTTTTRKLPRAGFDNALSGADFYAAPLTTGKYVLGVDFASWAADSASVGDSWKLGVNDSGGALIGQIIWEIDSATSVRLRFSTTTDGGSRFRNVTGFGIVEASAPTVELEFDFDNDTVRYLVDGAETHQNTFKSAEVSEQAKKETY